MSDYMRMVPSCRIPLVGISIIDRSHWRIAMAICTHCQNPHGITIDDLMRLLELHERMESHISGATSVECERHHAGLRESMRHILLRGEPARQQHDACGVFVDHIRDRDVPWFQMHREEAIIAAESMFGIYGSERPVRRSRRGTEPRLRAIQARDAQADDTPTERIPRVQVTPR